MTGLPARPLPEVQLAPDIWVADASQRDVVARAVALSAEARRDGHARIATALHVGGLNESRLPSYRRALAQCNLRYADGAATVLLAKLAGARHIERAATTDIGLPIIAEIGRRASRPARVALIGGPEGLADRAARTVRETAGARIGPCLSGFREPSQWPELFRGLAHAEPDVVLVGLGAPRETIVVTRLAEQLPGCLVLTCGGWFGFLAGDERRAPARAQRLGLEWVARLAQDPRRLGPRYAKGLWTTARLAAAIGWRRATRRS